MLEHAGYTVLEAANGHEALSWLRARIAADRPAGHRRGHARHERPRAGSSRLRARTARAQGALHVRLRRRRRRRVSGVLERGRAFLQKPFTADQLASYVRGVLDGRRIHESKGRRMMSRPVLLVVDDEPIVGAVMKRLAEPAGFEVVVCSSAAEAVATLARHPADMAFVDLRMPDINGIDLLRQIRDTVPACEVVLMSGFATIDSAVEAVKLGALDYLTKPLDFDRVTALLKDVARRGRAPRSACCKIESRVARELEFHGMLGRSAAMQEVFSLIRRLAPHVRTVLITGETGTGKELVAHALHQQGPRRARRFVTVNCSAVVETLFESELFGHVRGAFTGATEHKPGLFEPAHDGTLFLDEIGELPLSLQAKLLRALENGEVQRVGVVEPRRVDTCVFRRDQPRPAAGRGAPAGSDRLAVPPERRRSARCRRCGTGVKTSRT